MRKNAFELLLWLTLMSAACGGPERPTGTLNLEPVRDSLQAHVDRGELPGATLLVLHGEAPPQTLTVGFADLESRTPLTDRSLFRLASATKIWVSVALLTLVDDGRVALTDPVSQHIPEFSGLRLLDEGDTSDRSIRQPTILDLLRHTGGLGYGYEDPYQSALVEAGLLRTETKFSMDWSHPWDLDEWVARLADVPLEAEPASEFSYGLHHDVLGLVVERASGQRLDRFMAERLLEPLGLTDSGFMVDADGLDDLASFYSFEDGRLVKVETAAESPFRRAPRAPSGGGGWDELGNGGMVSSARDFARLLKMLFDGGVLDGRRILQPETAALFMQNHLEGIGSGDSYWPGVGFSFGFAYLYDPERYTGEGGLGKIWWAGSTNVYFWVDPELDLTGVFMANVLPFGHLEVMDAVETLVYEAVRDERETR